MEYTARDLTKLSAITDVRDAVLKAPWNVGQKESMIRHLIELKQNILIEIVQRTCGEQLDEDLKMLISPHDLVATQPQTSWPGRWIQWWEPLEKRLESMGFVSVPCNCGENVRKMYNEEAFMHLTAEIDQQLISILQDNKVDTPKTYQLEVKDETSWEALRKAAKFAKIVKSLIGRLNEFINYTPPLIPEDDEDESVWEERDYHRAANMVDRMLEELGLYTIEANTPNWISYERRKAKKGKSSRVLVGSYIGGNHGGRIEHLSDKICLVIFIGAEGEDDYEEIGINILDPGGWAALAHQLLTWDLLKL